jgi:hypothetical protein
MRTLLHLLLLASLLCSGCVFRWWLRHPAATAEIESKKSIPLRIFGSALLVQASVDGSAPMWFFVDTGAPISAIDPTLIKAAPSARHSKRRIGVGGATEGKSSSRVVRFDSLQIGDISFDRVIAIELDMTPIEEVLGLELGGILGLSVFEDFLLTLDYPNQTMLLEEGELPQQNNKTILPYTLSQRHMMIPLSHNGGTVSVAIDSGCNSAIYLPEAKEKSFSFATPPVIAGTAMGATGEAEVRAGRVNGALSMGSFVVNDPLITFAKTDLALLGGPILRHFAVTIDQKNKRVRFVQPEPKEITIPALRRFVGIKKKKGQWVVSSIRGSTSPFLATGDVIVSANDREASTMDYSDWEALIDKPEPIRLIMLREGVQLELSISSEVIVP